MEKELLTKVLKSLVDFSEQELGQIVNCFMPKFAKRNEILLFAGDVCNEFYYVANGCIRIYFLDKNGHEKTRYIMPKYHIGTALTSFIAQEPSIEFIEALEDSELLAISHTDFYRLNKELAGWKNFYQCILEMAYTFQNKRIEQLVTLTAKQRYNLVLKETPSLIQGVSNKVLASYLDIREETLSRLKST
jgi:CRP-like cAMP-binding protein